MLKQAEVERVEPNKNLFIQCPITAHTMQNCTLIGPSGPVSARTQ